MNLKQLQLLLWLSAGFISRKETKMGRKGGGGEGSELQCSESVFIFSLTPLLIFTIFARNPFQYLIFIIVLITRPGASIRKPRNPLRVQVRVEFSSVFSGMPNQ